jgi:hypothetical protein
MRFECIPFSVRFTTKKAHDVSSTVKSYSIPCVIRVAITDYTVIVESADILLPLHSTHETTYAVCTAFRSLNYKYTVISISHRLHRIHLYYRISLYYTFLYRAFTCGAGIALNAYMTRESI